MAPMRVLLLDDDDTFRGLLAKQLERVGFSPLPVANVKAALDAVATEEFDVALLDLRLPDGTGIDVLRELRTRRPDAEVILLTGHGSIDTAVEAMREGAFDYLRKPCNALELENTLRRALERSRLIRRNTILEDGLAPLDRSADFVGQSPAFAALQARVERVARTDSTVLILGETGAGKDVVANLIHARSARAQKPFVVVECATLTGELLNNEIFGHEKGAYTGAGQAKHGLFEVADGGTIFLDEIGDVSLETQVKLLRVLETGRFRRVGGTREIQVDVRIVAATNRDLPTMMKKGLFRTDLYYRLAGVQVEVPPLRERRDDVPRLARHFLAELNQRFGQQKRLSPEAEGALSRHHWPGNVRELLHALEQAVILTDGDLVRPEHLPSGLRPGASGPSEELLPLEEVERRHILRVLDATQGNRQRAAEILGISERTLYRKLRDLEL